MAECETLEHPRRGATASGATADRLCPTAGDCADARVIDPVLRGAVSRAFARSVQWLALRRPSGPVPGAAFGPERNETAVERELDAIRAYAQFIARYPDMPADHRARFLGQIQRCTDAVRQRVS